MTSNPSTLAKLAGALNPPGPSQPRRSRWSGAPRRRHPSSAAAWRGARALLASACIALWGPGAGSAGAAAGGWPEGAQRVAFENVDGAILVEARLHVAPMTQALVGARTVADTTGKMVLDTGAGYVVLDVGLARALGLVAGRHRGLGAAGLATADAPLSELWLGEHSAPELEPVLLFDSEIVRRAIGRDVLGLIGRQAFGESAVIIDYGSDSLAIVPSSLAEAGRGSVVPFALLGDAKIVVRAAIGEGPMADYVLDTGATKCVIFDYALKKVAAGYRGWRRMRGLVAPTVAGDVPVQVLRLPRLRVGEKGPEVEGVEAGVGAGTLGRQLSQVTGREIAGLIGYSYLKRFRVTLDYPRQRLLLEPLPDFHERRPYEFVHVGLQLAKKDGEVEVVAVARGSPAGSAGLRPGDVVVKVDDLEAEGADLLDLARALEGPAGTRVRLVVRRKGAERALVLERRQLL